MTQKNGRMPITLDALLTGDRTLFQLCPGDEETPAQLTAAELKEVVVAVNASSERILGLYDDLLKAEARIEVLEHRLQAITNANDEGVLHEPLPPLSTAH